MKNCDLCGNELEKLQYRVFRMNDREVSPGIFRADKYRVCLECMYRTTEIELKRQLANVGEPVGNIDQLPCE